jgi:hypothetical protein
MKKAITVRLDKSRRVRREGDAVLVVGGRGSRGKGRQADEVCAHQDFGRLTQP